MKPADPSVLERLPPELADLEFGSPEFKQQNLKLCLEAEKHLSPVNLGMPTWLNLTGTTVCNLKCFMCNQFLDPDSPKLMMDEAVYGRVVRDLYPFARVVQFSAFGEPLMTPGFDSKVDDCERYGVKLEMVTNATLMMKYDAFRQKLLRNLELVTFSMDGATRETYNSVRTGAEYNEVVENISQFASRRMDLPAEQRPRMNFNYILMKRTVAEAPRFVEMVHEWGGDEIVFNHLAMFHPSLETEALTTCREFANEHMDATRARAAELGVKLNIPDNFVIGPEPATDPAAASSCADAPGPQGEKARPCGPPPIKCWFLWRRAYITPGGDVVPCCLAGMPSFGNMMRTPFHEIWNNPTYRKHREKVFTPEPFGKCRNCYLIYPNHDLAGAEGFAIY